MSDNTAHQKVWITGVGLLSSLGEGTNDHWNAMNAGKPMNVDTERFAPYPVHGLGTVEWSNQMSRRDMRQMEPWQQIGTYAAGLALDDAGVKENTELCGLMDMIVAAGGGERDAETDSNIMREARGKSEVEGILAERMSNDLRPTLFLAQLSNLLAGNISIVHKVTGSSRTFMGEEGAGISAIQTASARIASGQSDIALVGGAFNGEREDMMLSFELGQYLLQGELTPVWDRPNGRDGLAMGSIGVFLVLESEDHARKRGAEPYAAISGVAADHGHRAAGAATKRLSKALDKLDVGETNAILSAATGVRDITNEERTFLNTNLPGAAVRAFGSLMGHGNETQFPLGIAIAALALKNGAFYAPLQPEETKHVGDLNSVLVTTVGHWRSEGLGLVTRVSG